MKTLVRADRSSFRSVLFCPLPAYIYRKTEKERYRMREKKKTETVKEDMFVKLTVLQILFAVLIIVIFFCAYKLNAVFFGVLKEDYLTLMAEDKDIAEYIPYNFLKETTTEAPATEESTEETTETESYEGAGGEDSDIPQETNAVDAAALSVFAGAVMPVNGTFTSGFGSRIHPVYGTEGFHSGTDIAAPEGTPILASLDGEVIACGAGEMSGNYVKLDNGGGIETLYCHCSSLNISKGDKVKAGDIIAFVGQTGLATGPHLHFELHINGTKSEPMLLLENAVSVS